jgi:hypothetical protein
MQENSHRWRKETVRYRKQITTVNKNKKAGRQPAFFVLFCFWSNWGLNSALCLQSYKANNHKAGTLLLEPHLQSILLWLFWRWGLKNYLAGLASNVQTPNLSLLS